MKTRVSNPKYLEKKAERLDRISGAFCLLGVIFMAIAAFVFSPTYVLAAPFFTILPGYVFGENAAELRNEAHRIRIKYNIK